MDVEPGRCRRTDGKKWRCRWPVLPHQKYCERHVHRGRFRSRKPVEVPKTVPTSNSTVSSLKPPVQVHVKNQSFKMMKRSRENALEFGFSRKGVLQNGNVEGSGPSSIDHNLTLAVPGTKRCRRTDGKKWRCRKDALPRQSYCIQHMHRGVKKAEHRQKLNAFLVGSSFQQIDNVGNRSNDDSSGGDATAAST